MKLIVYKDFEFDFAHHLPNYKGKGKCQSYHGHRGKLRVYIEGFVNRESGMVIDFADVKEIINDKVISKLDHININNIISIPTAENILEWTYEQLKYNIPDSCYIIKLEFWETPSSGCIKNIRPPHYECDDHVNRYGKQFLY